MHYLFTFHQNRVINHAKEPAEGQPVGKKTKSRAQKDVASDISAHHADAEQEYRCRGKEHEQKIQDKNRCAAQRKRDAHQPEAAVDNAEQHA